MQPDTPATPDVAPLVAVALTSIRGRLPSYGKARAYYGGQHPPVYDTATWQREFGKTTVEPPRDNLCPTIVETLVSRLKPGTFRPRFPSLPNAQRDADAANVIWRRNRMDEQAPEIHRTAAMCGDAYILVSETAGKAVLTRLAPEGCHIEYDPEIAGRRLWGARWWVTSGLVRVNIIRPEGTYRLVTNRAGWTDKQLPQQMAAFRPFEDDGLPWFRPNPMPAAGLPLFHLPNGAPTGEYGRSELDPAYSLQDHINSGLCDLVLAMRSVGIPWRVISGVTTRKQTPLPVLGGGLPDAPAPFPTGEDVFPEARRPVQAPDGSIDAGPGKVITLENENARAQQLAASALEGPITFVETLRVALARNTRRPLHALGLASTNPATATEIAVADAVFVAEIRARQTTAGNVWEDVLAYGVQVELSHNDAGEFVGLHEAPMLELTWAPAEQTPEPTPVDLLKAGVDAGLPLQFLLERFYGLSAEEAAGVLAQADVEAALAADRAAAVLDAGKVPYLTGE